MELELLVLWDPCEPEWKLAEDYCKLVKLFSFCFPPQQPGALCFMHT